MRGQVTGISQSLLPLLKSNTLSIKNKLIIYNARISILIYAYLIWGFVKPIYRSHDKNLQTKRNYYRYLRITTIRRDLGTKSLKKKDLVSYLKIVIKIFITVPIT